MQREATMRLPVKWSCLAFAGLLAWGILNGGDGGAFAQGMAADARWNALFDRLIRLEHEVRALRRGGEAASTKRGAGVLRIEGRLKALEAEIASLRKDVNRRLRTLDARLRRLEKRRGMKAGSVDLVPDVPGVGKNRTMPEVRSSDMGGEETFQSDRTYDLGKGSTYDPDLFAGSAQEPHMTTTLSPPSPSGEKEQLLGRLRVDDAGNPLPSVERGAKGTDSSVSNGPRPLPGVREIYRRQGISSGVHEGITAGVLDKTSLVPPPVKAAPLTPPSVQVARADTGSLLKRARDAFLARRYGLAVTAYRDFLKQAGTHPVRAEAQYELGEALYLQGRYREAGKAFLQSYKTDENSRVAPMALYKLGLTLKRLGQNKQACKTWKLLRGRYADSRAARLLAPVEMRRAKCRG